MAKSSHGLFIEATHRANAKRYQSYINNDSADILNSFTDITTEELPANPFEVQRLWGQGFDVAIRKDFVRVKLFKHNALVGCRNAMFPMGMPSDQAIVVFPTTNRKSVFL